MKVALIADWLPTFAGAERVVAEFCALWPDAPVFTTLARHSQLAPLKGVDIRTTRLQKWYVLLRKHYGLLPWMPRALEDIDLRGFDVIISSSHAVGKGVVPPSSAVHICYCHTPMRYAWEMERQYLQDFHVPKLLRGRVRRKLAELRRWDLTTAQRVDVFVANSSATQERIQRIYGRESSVLPPPVHDRFFQTPVASPTPDAPYIAVGRMVPYKRFDLLIDLANAHRLPLLIVGTGQKEQALRKRAGPTVKFLGYVQDEELPKLYGQARALLFPQLEDAGVVPLEAQACGTPVIALGQGGVRDTVRNGVTGLFFQEQTTDSLLEALQRFERTPWDRSAIREHCRQFRAELFRERMTTIVQRALALYQSEQNRSLHPESLN